MGTPADSERARKSLVDAACQVFAQHGYQSATVRQICSRAGQNPSAINYHFGSKEELYRQVLRLAGPREHDPPTDLLQAASSRDRLKAFIALFLAESLGAEEEPWKARVMVQELASPSAMLDDLVRTAIRPHFDALQATVADLLGLGESPDAEERQLVSDHAFGVVSQVVFYRHSRPVVERIAGRRYGERDMSRLAAHIARAVLAAIAADRRRLRARPASLPAESSSQTETT
jgi:AcrR family transcriptional regulator